MAVMEWWKYYIFNKEFRIFKLDELLIYYNKKRLTMDNYFINIPRLIPQKTYW